jgi:hypothetical protein
MFLRLINGPNSCVEAEYKCDKCDAIYTESQPHTCNTNAYYADIVVTRRIPYYKGRTSVCTYALKIARYGEKLRGRGNKSIELATFTGADIPQWMERAKQAINTGKPESELTARLMASIEQERNQ